MMRRDDELITDYKGKCGNCHSRLRKNDKYCRYCGTMKGKGKFLPYRNEMYCVYGPPIKEIFRCTKCGYRWGAVGLGGDGSKYCPQCGAANVQNELRECREFWDFVGTDLSEEVPDGYQFLSEEEIKTLLNLRTDKDEDSEKAAARIKKAGFIDWAIAERREEELTERVAERANLQRAIIEDIKGKNPFAIKKICPKCNGGIIAGMRYKNFENEYQKIDYRDESGEGLYCDAHFYWRDVDTDPTHYCLQCGERFK